MSRADWTFGGAATLTPLGGGCQKLAQIFRPTNILFSIISAKFVRLAHKTGPAPAAATVPEAAFPRKRPVHSSCAVAGGPAVATILSVAERWRRSR
jgi:hypothetical protein